MSSSGDMANSEEAISKAELRSDGNYRQAAVLSIQKRQRENMRWQVIGKLVAVIFVGSFMAFWFLVGYFR